MPTDKQRTLLDGALRLFARDGYARASIDALAAEAGVSSRTIYNHYGDKAGLFRAVILDSSDHVAERQIALADALLGRVVDLEADLVEFGVRWATPEPDFAPHFRLVRHIEADLDNIDPATVAAWHERGPLRVRHALAAHLGRLSDAGLLAIEDPLLAAVHLVHLTATSVAAVPDADREAVVRAGVKVFLRAYGA
ncbi:TetR/AcrR family transcriptional regulator [Labedaea rhizosphaerae]|uniref:TetR family transcriptional regulator n=1 Tax=Labedaea rhizosphaerae TaxID=598644 RepID=A0A4R6S9E5_LABRH|nr:TetR/AcrR family transcriptional regulator [Labedaea rhizosphaerae]TDP96500.1 TetR family transcriptional regulator [Labedaea rhizosphaerae]